MKLRFRNNATFFARAHIESKVAPERKAAQVALERKRNVSERATHTNWERALCERAFCERAEL